MPQIIDNIELHLLPILHDTILLAYRADFYVGYFNLRGWKQIGACIEDRGSYPMNWISSSPMISIIG